MIHSAHSSHSQPSRATGPMLRHHRGISLLESTIAIVLFGLVAAAATVWLSQQNVQRTERYTAAFVDQVVGAADAYVREHHATLASAVAAGGPQVITIETIRNAGFDAPAGNADPFGQTYELIVAADGENLEAIVVSRAGTRAIADHEAASIAGQIRQGGVLGDGVARGYMGSWNNQVDVSGYDGALAARLALSADSLGTSLQRFSVPGAPEANRMETHLSMGGHGIADASAISTAAMMAEEGAITGALTVAGAATVGSLDAGTGQIRTGGWVRSNRLDVTGRADVGSLVAGGTIEGGTIVARVGFQTDGNITAGGQIRGASVLADQDMTAGRDLASGRDLSVGRHASIQGNVTAGGQVRGNSLRSDNDTAVGRDLSVERHASIQGNVTAGGQVRAETVRIGNQTLNEANAAMINALFGLDCAAGQVLRPTANGGVTCWDGDGRWLNRSSNLADLGNPVAARANLGLGAVAVRDIVPISQGGTGATTAAAARGNLGLGSMATQNMSNVNVTGGSIQGTQIGTNANRTPGYFSTLYAHQIRTGDVSEDRWCRADEAGRIRCNEEAPGANTTSLTAGTDYRYATLEGETTSNAWTTLDQIRVPVGGAVTLLFTFSGGGGIPTGEQADNCNSSSWVSGGLRVWSEGTVRSETFSGVTFAGGTCTLGTRQVTHTLTGLEAGDRLRLDGYINGGPTGYMTGRVIVASNTPSAWTM